jgi:AcrR family transcriptional regulator
MARPVDPNAKIDLLRAAEAVFVEHGLDRARVEEITARAGRSKGSFYLHFTSKEEAFRQIVETTIARMAGFLAHFDPDCCGVNASLPEIMTSWFEREVDLFEFLWQNRGVMRLLLQGGGGAHFAYLVDAFAERSREQTKEWLKVAIERGHYRPDLDVEVASLVISGAYDRTARALVRLERKPDIRAWVRGIQQVLMVGVANPEALTLPDRAVSEGTVEPPPVSAASPIATPITATRRRSNVRGI